MYCTLSAFTVILYSHGLKTVLFIYYVYIVCILCFRARLKMNRWKSTLTLSDEVKVIDDHEKMSLSVKDLVIKFKGGKTQIYETLLKKKEQIMTVNGWLSGVLKFATELVKTNYALSTVYSTYIIFSSFFFYFFFFFFKRLSKTET